MSTFTNGNPAATARPPPAFDSKREKSQAGPRSVSESAMHTASATDSVESLATPDTPGGSRPGRHRGLENRNNSAKLSVSADVNQPPSGEHRGSSRQLLNVEGSSPALLPRQTSQRSTVKVGSSRDLLRRVSSLKQSRTSTAGLLSSSGSRQRRSCREDDDDDDDVIFVRQRKEVLSYWSRTARLAHSPETTEDWETFLTSHKPLTTQQSMWLRQQVAAPGRSQEGSRKFSRMHPLPRTSSHCLSLSPNAFKSTLALIEQTEWKKLRSKLLASRQNSKPTTTTAPRRMSAGVQQQSPQTFQKRKLLIPHTGLQRTPTEAEAYSHKSQQTRPAAQGVRSRGNVPATPSVEGVRSSNSLQTTPSERDVRSRVDLQTTRSERGVRSRVDLLTTRSERGVRSRVDLLTTRSERGIRSRVDLLTTRSGRAVRSHVDLLTTRSGRGVDSSVDLKTTRSERGFRSRVDPQTTQTEHDERPMGGSRSKRPRSLSAADAESRGPSPRIIEQISIEKDFSGRSGTNFQSSSAHTVSSSSSFKWKSAKKTMDFVFLLSHRHDTHNASADPVNKANKQILDAMKKILAMKKRKANRWRWIRAIRLVLAVIRIGRQLKERSLEMEFEQKTFLDVADSAQVAAAAKDRKKRTTEEQPAGIMIKLTADSKRILTSPPESRTKDEINRVLLDLQFNPFFCALSLSAQRSLASVGTYHLVAKQRVIIRRGHIGTHYYFILSGQAQATKTSKTMSDGKEIKVTETILSQGQSFGEEALADGKPQKYSVISREKMQLLSVTRSDYIRIFLEEATDGIPAHVRFLGQQEWMKHWPLLQLLRHPTQSYMYYCRNRQVIVADSSQSDYIFVVRSGECCVLAPIGPIKCSWRDFPKLLAPDGIFVDDHIERLEASVAAEKSPGMAAQQDVSDMRQLDRVWNASFDSMIWAAKAKVRAQRRRSSSSGDRRGSGQRGALGSDGLRLSKTGTELAETAGQQPEQGAPSPVTQTGTCPPQQQEKVPPLKQPETEQPKKQEKPPETVAQKLLVEYSPSSSGDNRKSIPLRSTLKSYGSSLEPGASSELSSSSSSYRELRKGHSSVTFADQNQSNVETSVSKAAASPCDMNVGVTSDSEESSSDNEPNESGPRHHVHHFCPCLEPEEEPQVSSLELRKQYKVPKRCVPHVRRQVEAKKTYTASTGQLYVNIATLKKGDVFGFDQMTLPLLESLQVKGHPVSLVSCGAEVIALKKQFFVVNAGAMTQQAVLHMTRAFPSPFHLQHKLKFNMSWDLYIEKLKDELIEEATRGRKHHGLYFHPEPPIDPRTSLGHVEDN